MPKLIRITTVPLSLATLLKGQMRFMSNYYDVTAISSGKERLDKVGETEGVKIYSVELTRQITLIKDLKALWKLYFKSSKLAKFASFDDLSYLCGCNLTG